MFRLSTPDADGLDLSIQGLNSTDWLQAGGILLAAVAVAVADAVDIPYDDDPGEVFRGQPAEPPPPEPAEPAPSRWSWRPWR